MASSKGKADNGTAAKLARGIVAGVIAGAVASFAMDRFQAVASPLLPSNGSDSEPAADPAHRIVIGWGRHDRLCLSRQAPRAMAAFPSATLHWFEHSGHFPMWDMPHDATAVILQATT